MNCVLWEGDHYKTGYGRKYLPGERCSIQGGKGRRGKQVYAHRAVMAEIYGWDALEGKVVMHTCDVKDCVNPEHLRIGTHEDNRLDMVAKGRNRGGGWFGSHQR